MMALRVSYQGCKTGLLLYHECFSSKPTMEDSSDDDFIDLPGQLTHARVKRKEWPNQDDPGGTSSKKVGGGSGRTPQNKNSEEMTKEEKKKEAARIRKAKSRAKKKEDMSDEQQAVEREKNRQAVANHRNNLSEEQKAVAREKHRQEVASHRNKMPDEQKAVAREKHRQVMAIRRANMPEESMKEKSSKENVESKKYNERKSNMMYKRKVRLNQSKEEKELRKIEHVIQMRNNRATKIEENIEIEIRLAREDMKEIWQSSNSLFRSVKIHS